MTYKFKCSVCSVVQEIAMPMAQATFEDRPCVCGGKASHEPDGYPGISTANMGHKTLDVVVGASSDKRWEEMNRRQEIRNKVRAERQVTGLSEIQRDNFIPIPSRVTDTRSRLPV